MGDVHCLRNRIGELESTITALLLKLPASNAPNDVPPADDMGDTEEITLPSHQSPETLPAETQEPLAPKACYVLAEHQGILGVFNDRGELLYPVNVCFMTLPEADREALVPGIPAYSLEEICSLVERYS